MFYLLFSYDSLMDLRFGVHVRAARPWAFPEPQGDAPFPRVQGSIGAGVGLGAAAGAGVVVGKRSVTSESARTPALFSCARSRAPFKPQGADRKPLKAWVLAASTTPRRACVYRRGRGSALELR